MTHARAHGEVTVRYAQDCRKSKQKKKRPRNEEDSAEASAAKEDGKDAKKKRTSADGKSPRSAEAAEAAEAGATNPWDLVQCQQCGSAEDDANMILCDVCDGGYHLYCADPKLKKVPAGDWICQDCVASKPGGKKRRRRRTQAEMLLERAAVAAAGGSSSAAAAAAAGRAALHGKGEAKTKMEDGGVASAAEGGGLSGEGSVGDAQNPWDLVECQECGSAEGEERMILCDMCGELRLVFLASDQGWIIDGGELDQHVRSWGKRVRGRGRGRRLTADARCVRCCVGRRGVSP